MKSESVFAFNFAGHLQSNKQILMIIIFLNLYLPSLYYNHCIVKIYKNRKRF